MEKSTTELRGMCERCKQVIADEEPAKVRGKLYHSKCAPTTEELTKKDQSYT